MIIDAHTHIGKLPESEFSKNTFKQNLKLLLKEMANNKVDHVLLLPDFKKSEGFDSPNLETALKLAQGIKNISVIGTIDVLNHKKSDLDKLDTLFKQKKIVGIKLYLGYQPFYPNQEICTPIYKLCLKHDVPVIFHTGDTLIYEGYARVKYAHPLAIDDVATDFPDLKIVIAHLGNPWFVDCEEVLYKNKNVYGDLSGLVVGTSLDSPYGRLMKRKIQELMIYSSPRKLLYGTDWPLSPMKQYIRFVKSLGVSKIDLDYIFYKNAMALFKIK